MPKRFVVGILCRDGEYLAERRRSDESKFPGAVVFPGGLIEDAESSDIALKRELREELGIEIAKCVFVGTYGYEDGCAADVFAVEQWTGEVCPHEATELCWISHAEELTNDFDRKILRELNQNLPRGHGAA